MIKVTWLHDHMIMRLSNYHQLSTAVSEYKRCFYCVFKETLKKLETFTQKKNSEMA